MKFKHLAMAALTTSMLSTFSVVAAPTEMQLEIQKILKMNHRDEADRKRDRNRSPINALEIFGLKSDMKVIEFAPGNGWYTKILAPLLKDKGELYLAYKSEWLKELEPILQHEKMNKAVKLPIPLDWNRDENRYQLGDLNFAMTDADMVLNIREYHNFNLEDKNKLNAAAFNALKPGGKYVIVDHSRRHMAPETKELSRREDPVQVILEVQKAGFMLTKSSDIFYRPDDELSYEVGRKTVTGNTDRFTLIFTKPE